MCSGQAEDVFSYMAGDFMKPVVDIVDQLLTAGVNVTVYNGQLDLIVDTMGNLFSSMLPSRPMIDMIDDETQDLFCAPNPSWSKTEVL